jgi:hypothetical protein
VASVAARGVGQLRAATTAFEKRSALAVDSSSMAVSSATRARPRHPTLRSEQR